MENFQMLFPYASTTRPSSTTYSLPSNMTDSHNSSCGFLGLKTEDDHQQLPSSAPLRRQGIDDIHFDHSCNGSFAIGSGSEIKPSKKKGEKKIRKPRYAFQTRSQVDILDDGYRWRKYGQKAVKNNKFPRSYYRCTHQGCNVKKQVQRLTKDEGVVVTTYEGVHTHPIERQTENFEHILNQMQIYTSI